MNALQMLVVWGGALQAGLERSSEPIVARMDADDVAAPARLAEQRAILLETDTDIVGTHLANFAMILIVPFEHVVSQEPTK